MWCGESKPDEALAWFQSYTHDIKKAEEEKIAMLHTTLKPSPYFLIYFGMSGNYERSVD